MSTTSNRSITVTFVGDASGTQTLNAAANQASPGETVPVALALGDNTIAVPQAGTVPTAVTILKPAGNVTLIKLKGQAADAGVALHKTDPDTISLDPTQASFVLNAAAGVNVRLIWS